VIACGGTGGHLSPGIALAEELICDGWECLLLISNKQVDSRLVEKYSKFKYAAVPAAPFSLSPIKLFRFLASLRAGVALCLRLYKTNPPDVVIGFGGFLSVPALLAGCFRRIPVAIHEANRAPGKVTRLVGRFANRIFLPPGVSLGNRKLDRIRYVGMPVRREICSGDQSQAKKSLGFDPARKLIVVLGGSQGARSLNEWTERNLEHFVEREIQALCLMGMSSGSDRELTRQSRSGADVAFRFIRFSDEMSLVLSAADVAVSRAGAGSISEIVTCGVPAILIPYPYAADNHQFFNAQRFVEQGGGASIEESRLNCLLPELMELILDDTRLKKCRAKLESINERRPQTEMVAELESLIGGAEQRSAGKKRGKEICSL